MLSRTTRKFTTLLFAELNQSGLVPSFPSLVNAATSFDDQTHVLVAGKDVNTAAEQASKIKGVDKVLTFNSDQLANGTAEDFAQLLKQIFDQGEYNRYMALNTVFGKDVFPRFAGQVEIQPISDIIKILSQDSFQRPTYAGNALYTVQQRQNPKILTIRPTAFEKNPEQSPSPIETLNLDVQYPNLSKFVSQQLSKSDRPDLATANRIVSAGRAIKAQENLKLIEQLAEVLGAAVGATRASVDAGYCSNDLQIGQTGKIVAPELYIAIGISGAIQHVAGMKDSKTIVAINTDPEAPIFNIADYGLVGDLFKIVPEMTQKLKGN